VSEFIKHEPCPNCGSRDNLGVWDDGHKYCFGCRYYVPSSIRSQLDELERVHADSVVATGRDGSNHRNGGVSSISLPDDFSNNIPAIGLQWLKKYITDQEIRKHGIGYSHSGVFLVKRNIQLSPLLVLPVWGGNHELLAWQGRYMGEETVYPKYYTRHSDVHGCHVLGSSNSNPLVAVCEDIVSAIKVSRVVDAMPLLGSFLSKEKALSLAKLYNQLTIWLDYDKAKEAVKQAAAYAPFFKEVKTVIAERDPKEYSTDEIRGYLGIGIY
jgi:hypothetical protein